MLFPKGIFTAASIPNSLGNCSQRKGISSLKWELFSLSAWTALLDLCIQVLPLNTNTNGCGFIYFTFYPHKPSLHHRCPSTSAREGNPTDTPEPPLLWTFFVLIQIFLRVKKPQTINQSKDTAKKNREKTLQVACWQLGVYPSRRPLWSALLLAFNSSWMIFVTVKEFAATPWQQR